MSDRIEQFIRDNRDSFDENDPSAGVWKKIDRDISPRSAVINMTILKWAVAAVLVISVLSASIWFLTRSGNKNNQPDLVTNQSTDIFNEIDSVYAKEVYHFTQLIELKQNELKQIGKDQPELYQQFMQDITQLDSSYNSLKSELPVNPNREQLLEAMIENLQLQSDLLNQQLQIIKKIKESKQKTNDNSYKKT